MTKVKLCGIKSLQDIEAVNQCKPHYIGFIFVPKSRRYITPETARELKARLAPSIRTVGVFQNATTEEILALLRENSKLLDVVQLHGRESDEEIWQLKRHTDKKIWKAYAISKDTDFAEINASPADVVLLDSGSGGSGIPFDWRLLSNIKRPYFLAGGIHLNNIDTALSHHPYGVDLSSGIETDGKKDFTKMKQIMERIRKEPIL